MAGQLQAFSCIPLLASQKAAIHSDQKALECIACSTATARMYSVAIGSWMQMGAPREPDIGFKTTVKLHVAGQYSCGWSDHDNHQNIIGNIYTLQVHCRPLHNSTVVLSCSWMCRGSKVQGPCGPVWQCLFRQSSLARAAASMQVLGAMRIKLLWYSMDAHPGGQALVSLIDGLAVQSVWKAVSGDIASGLPERY